jgi:hypothetical protein
MGINLTWQDEDGTPLGEVVDSHGSLSKLMTQNAYPHTVCLRFIDPYGDTVFNQPQISVLLSEMQTLLASIVDPQVRDDLQTMTNLVAKSRGEVHTYLKFVGD